MADRFEELADDKEGKNNKGCPNCGCRDTTDELTVPGMEPNLMKLGPNWRQCLACGHLFIELTNRPFVPIT